jgi:dipeptidyl aminopeptidase/acylaminoacyl peptidase
MGSIARNGWVRFFTGCLVAFAASVASAQDTLSIEDIWKAPQLSTPVLSRDRKYMAVTMPFKGRMNLAVVDLETRKASILTSYDLFDVQGVRWLGNERLLYTLGQNNSPTGAGEFDGGGLFVIGRDGKGFRTLAETVREARAQKKYVYRRLEFFRRIPGNDEEIIASGNMTVADSTDLYRLNTRTGRYTLMTQGRPSELTSTWLVDDKLVPRVVVAGVKDKLTTVVYYRKDEKSDWYEIARYDRDKGAIFVPLTIDDKDQLQVAYNGGRDTMAVFRYDPNAKKMGELIAQHPYYDMGANAFGGSVSGVVVDPDTEKLLGYSVAAAKPEVVWLDEKYAAIQKSLDGAFPGKINRFQRAPDGKRFIVTSSSDISSPRWYLFDEEKKTLEPIGASRPWLDGKLVEQRPFRYKTRDGLEIDGYYFLPKDYRPGTKLPTIVHIHGGPFARADSWGSGFGVREGQLFASRGYAVIVPNFRITPGLGTKIFQAGFGTVGRQMSDDHEDARQWGIEQGFVQPDKVCISGASYGGYAALQALVRANEKWKCAIAGLAVTDYKYQLTTQEGDTAPNEAAVTFWKAVLGESDLSSNMTREISPVFNAAKIKRPVFMYAGIDDLRVPLAQITRMRNALEASGNPVKGFVTKEKEGHGFGKLENSVDLYTQILAFLKEQFGQ